MALLAVMASAAPAVYERPQNSDCIATSAGGLSLFPEQYLLLGDSQKNASSYVEVGGRALVIINHHGNLAKPLTHWAAVNTQFEAHNAANSARQSGAAGH